MKTHYLLSNNECSTNKLFLAFFCIIMIIMTITLLNNRLLSHGNGNERGMNNMHIMPLFLCWERFTKWIDCYIKLNQKLGIFEHASPTSPSHCKWRVCGHGQTTSKPHPMVYKTTRAYWKKSSSVWKFGGWKIKVCMMKELIVHPTVWENLCGTL